MKIQHLTVIFILIILPISVTLSTYLSSQIDAIVAQNAYDAALHDSTHDLVKAFQLNTVNNKFSTISDSKIRDIEAAVNTFYNSLGANLGASGYDKNTIKNFTPAILFNLYDGYYIYSKYKNEGNGKVNTDPVEGTDEPQDGLKPFAYYSARYVNGNTDIVVNYTLDNYITIMGTVDGIYEPSTHNLKYITKSGYLVNTEAYNGTMSLDTSDPINYELNVSEINYDGVIIRDDGEANLTEFLVVLGTDGKIDLDNSKEYKYSMYNSQKIYVNDVATTDDEKYFIYNKYQRNWIKDTNMIQTLDARSNGNSISAFEYYKSAYEFSAWVKEKLGTTITIENLVDSSGNSAGYYQSLAYTPEYIDIFDVRDENDPMLNESSFNEHRKAIIRKSIEENVQIAMSNFTHFNDETLYNYAMPELSEIDWDKIVNNISVLTFLQGIPMKYKFYNNYVVVTNNKNQELVDNSSIYIIDEVNHVYHKPGCTELMENTTANNLIGYNIIDFLRQTAKQTENSEAYYFYPKCTRGEKVVNIINNINNQSVSVFLPVDSTNNQISPNTACYNCIVNAKATYSVDDIIRGEIERVNDDGTTDVLYSKNGTGVDNEHFKDVRTAYLTALARCRYDLYKISGYFEAEN